MTGTDRTEANEIRDRARTARRDLEPSARRAAEASLTRHLLELDELESSADDDRPRRMALYLSTDGEVDLSGAADEVAGRGWQVLLPVIGPARSMSFAPWSPGSPLVANRYGIPEPAHGVGDLVPAQELDVVVLPCVAVDRSGHRLGFGAGYYDRALAEAAATQRIGVAFEVQVVDRIDPAPWDVPLDVVVTEAGVIRP